MTLIIGCLAPRFALVVSDTLAKVGGLRLVPYRKLELSEDETELFGIAGVMQTHTYLELARKLRGEEADRLALDWGQQTASAPNSESLPEHIAGMANEVLHAYSVGNRLLLTVVNASSGHCLLRTLKSQQDALLMSAIGSGAEIVQALVNVPSINSQWQHLVAHAESVTPQEVHGFFQGFFKAAAAFQDSVGEHTASMLLEPAVAGTWRAVDETNVPLSVQIGWSPAPPRE